MKKTIRGRGVDVYGGNFEKALRTFRKKIQKDGLIQEVRDRETYTKPNELKRLAKKAAIRQTKKDLAASLPKKLY